MPARHHRLAIAVLTLLASLPARAQSLPSPDPGATEPSGTAAQLSLVSTRSLNFGRFVAGNGGAVSIDPSGARSPSGGVILMNSAGAGSAGFSLSTLNGSGASELVVVSLPEDGVVTLTNGQFSMPVRNFVSSSGTVLTLPPSGTAFSVGATLSVTANQPAGSYSGSFQITINYQ